MIKLPEGMRASFTIYLVTEVMREEADIALTVSGFSMVPEFTEPLDAEKIAVALNLDAPLDFTKTRLMTAAEIAEYRRNEDAGESDNA